MAFFSFRKSEIYWYCLVHFDLFSLIVQSIPLFCSLDKYLLSTYNMPVTVLGSLDVVVVQLLSPIQLFVTPSTAARQAWLALTISQSLPKFMSIQL